MHSTDNLESPPALRLSFLIRDIIYELTGKRTKKLSVIKINNENHRENGELCFLTSIHSWRNYVIPENLNSKTILEYYLAKKNKLKQEYTEEEIANVVITSLIDQSKNWDFKIEKCCVHNERVHIFLDRLNISKIIKTAIHYGQYYGNNQTLNSKKIYLNADLKKDSSLTQKRLELMKDVTKNILKSQGYCISDEPCDNNFIFTTKSQEKCSENNSRYICGVVRSATSNENEISMTYEQYFQMKLDRITEISEQKLNEECKVISHNMLLNITNAVINFEMLSVKPSRTVIMKCNDKCIEDVKAATFVLYNTARISGIFQKYNEKTKCNKYPELWDIEQVDFSLLNQEEEWKLVYNFILAYPEMLHNAVKFESYFEICPQHICYFIQHLCQLFSIYYRKTRILVEGYPHLIPTVMARIYLLKALEIVLHNGLRLINVNSIKYM